MKTAQDDERSCALKQHYHCTQHHNPNLEINKWATCGFELHMKMEMLQELMRLKCYQNELSLFINIDLIIEIDFLT